MSNINEKKYPNIAEAVAFRVAFSTMLFGYDSMSWDELEICSCSRCSKYKQYADFMAPNASCKKKDGVILSSYYYGVSISIHDELIQKFDISEQDFRPIRNKTGDIVFYQLSPCHTMLPIGSVNRFRRLIPCKKCGSIQCREKEYKNKNGYQYSFITEEALNDLHDLNRTYEEFEMHFPKWVVSRRVYDYFAKNYPRLQFEPIFLKE